MRSAHRPPSSIERFLVLVLVGFITVDLLLVVPSFASELRLDRLHPSLPIVNLRPLAAGRARIADGLGEEFTAPVRALAGELEQAGAKAFNAVLYDLNGEASMALVPSATPTPVPTSTPIPSYTPTTTAGPSEPNPTMTPSQVAVVTAIAVCTALPATACQPAPDPSSTPTTIATSTPLPSYTHTATASPQAEDRDTYFVSASGNDNDPGTENSPWRTIQKAANSLVAGDTVYIREGTYRERVVVQNSGAPRSYITFAAYPGEAVTIDGSSVSVKDPQGLFDVRNKSYIRISGLRVINSTYAGIFGWNASHIIVEKNYIYNTSSSGIMIWDSDNIIIDSNEINYANDGTYDTAVLILRHTDRFEVKNNHVHHGQLVSKGGEGISLVKGCSNGSINGNHIHDLTRIGIYLDAADTRSHNIEIFQNVVHDNLTDGIDVASEQGGLVENIRIYNNIVYNNASNGIAIADWPSTYGHPMDSIYLLNNTIYNNGWDNAGWAAGIKHTNSEADNVVIRNNILSQNSEQLDLATSSDLSVDNNLIDGSTQDYGNDSIQGDPSFINASGADFHLQPGSLAVDTGITIGEVGSDFDGNSRPRGSGYDIGAYESH